MGAPEFVAAARAFKGARWRHRGRKPWAIDCLGLIVLAGAASGCPNSHDEPHYGREPIDGLLHEGCMRRWGAALPVTDARPGDIAEIRWGKCEPSHLAIVGDRPGGGLTLIHAHSIQGVIEATMTRTYQMTVLAVFRPWA